MIPDINSNQYKGIKTTGNNKYVENKKDFMVF